MKRRVGYRLINVDGVTWQYRIGQNTAIAISEHGEKRLIPVWKLAGYSSPDTLERARWKCYREIVTPRHVADWLLGELSGKANTISAIFPANR